MKIKPLIALFVLAPAIAAATTIYDIAGDRLGQGRLSASYTERYFEYDQAYFDNNLGSAFAIKKILSYNNLLSGIEQNFHIRIGVSEDITLSADMYYVYQKLENYNFNQMQSLSLAMNIYGNDGMGLMMGVRLPMTQPLPDDVRLIDHALSPGMLLGVFIKGGFWLINYTGQAGYEADLNSLMNAGPYYGDEAVINGSLGFTLFNEPKKQVIDIIMEAEYSTGRYDKKVLLITPQARMVFYNDFTAIVGVETIAFAENAYLNDQSKYQYIFKVDYMMNSPNRKSGTEAMVLPVIPGEPTPGITPQLTPQLTPTPGI